MSLKRGRRISFFLKLLFCISVFCGFLIFFPQLAVQPESQTKNSQDISTIIIPHFDFFKDKRQAFIDSLPNDLNPKKIIVVSVDHFNAGPTDITITKKSWNFQNVKISPENEMYENLIDLKIASSDDITFDTEHGIKNVLPDLAQRFKKAEFLPIIIKSTTPKNEVDKLNDQLTKCKDCLLVASVDFSHYNQSALAEIHDQYSVDALSDLDLDKIWSAETDSPQTLYLAARFAKEKDTPNFDLFFNSNSGEAASKDDSETTSVVIGSYSLKESSQKIEKSATFLFGGDLMFDRLINHQFKDTGFDKIFDQFGNRVFWGSDLAVANLEGPISDQPILDDVSTDNLVFNFPTKSLDALRFLKLNAVSLANNHTSNAGQSGFDITKALLVKNQIGFFGSSDGINKNSVKEFLSPIPISVIGVNLLSSPNEQEIIKMIKDEKNKDNFVILYPHWGSEYQKKHSANQSSVAHSWIDNGADMIIGSHPHVTQDFEIYNGKPIIYSLGNLLFDQTFSLDTQEGLLVGGIITEKNVQISFFPTRQVKLKPELLVGAEKQAKIESIINIEGQNGFKKLKSDTITIDR
ncbi:MAG: AmmeMemoRadiSam system protein B [Candidatus Berkelbacteria bacterium]|nr:AmmeMemoRadiSam system protein B [Candidatus Berkelbacteria bacterium]